MKYETEMLFYYYDIMAGCELGGCADYHLAMCCLNSGCFYSNMISACYTSLDMGWY